MPAVGELKRVNDLLRVTASAAEGWLKFKIGPTRFHAPKSRQACHSCGSLLQTPLVTASVAVADAIATFRPPV